jgi:hypothetical protein
MVGDRTECALVMLSKLLGYDAETYRQTIEVLH